MTLGKDYTHNQADVIVIGAGHAGIEAAVAAARLGCQTLLLTMNLDTIGQMSCNPAIGGPAKSQLVKEIDALGGVMGICADATYLQLRMLNMSKGPAVRALRAQSDKAEYHHFCRTLVETIPNLRMRQTNITKVLTDPKTKAVIGVQDHLGIQYHAPALVITTGTFLNGRLWVGEESFGGGRPGDPPATGISACLTELGMTMGRLKTGTPPRLDGRTIDFSNLEVQPGDENPAFFSFLPNRPVRKQLPCHITRTTQKTHELIQANLHRSPMFMGLFDGTGPRYCPSIEDKVVRFADKDSHHLFIEPEGLDTYEVYLQGFSTSLPYDLQIEMVRTLPGCEKAELLRPACAVEYDYFPAYQLEPSLMVKTIPGLYLAGQINGTSGYEEAGAQGLIAGINAARYVEKQDPLILPRSSSYTGTLIDDLVTKEILEPYRMLTSRSEYRLMLRQDNADVRLTPIGREIGLVDDTRWQVFQEKQAAVLAEQQRFTTTKLGPELSEQLFTLCGERIHEKMSITALLRRPAVTLDVLKQLDPVSTQTPNDILEYVDTEIKYEGYMQRQGQAIVRMQSIDKVRIPQDFDYFGLKQLSMEAREKLSKLRPVDLGQASRMNGVTPADIQILQVYFTAKTKQPKTPASIS